MASLRGAIMAVAALAAASRLAEAPPNSQPNPLKLPGTSAAEGVAADVAGNIYGAEVGPKTLKKYVSK